MARAVWKGPFVDYHVLEKVKKCKESDKMFVINTRSRRTTIIPFFIGITFGVHNGKKFIPVLITENMVGMKLGEFAPTRNHPGYSSAGSDKKVKK